MLVNLEFTHRRLNCSDIPRPCLMKD